MINENIDIASCMKFNDSIFIKDNEMYAKCKNGFLKINVIQKSGKNKMTAKDFINGLKSK